MRLILQDDLLQLFWVVTRGFCEILVSGLQCVVMLLVFPCLALISGLGSRCTAFGSAAEATGCGRQTSGASLCNRVLMCGVVDLFDGGD